VPIGVSSLGVSLRFIINITSNKSIFNKSIVVITSTAPLLWPEFLRLLGTVVSGITNSNTIKPALGT